MSAISIYYWNHIYLQKLHVQKQFFIGKDALMFLSYILVRFCTTYMKLLRNSSFKLHSSFCITIYFFSNKLQNFKIFHSLQPTLDFDRMFSLQNITDKDEVIVSCWILIGFLFSGLFAYQSYINTCQSNIARFHLV